MPQKKTAPTGYWTFFCSPSTWSIDAGLAEGNPSDHYSITAWQKDSFKVGQFGVIRVGNDNRRVGQLGGMPRLKPGVYAVVQVTGLPRPRGHILEKHWNHSTPPDPQALVVDIVFVRNLLASPILLADLAADPAVKDKYLVRGFEASSMPLDPQSFERLLEIADVPEVSLPEVAAPPAATDEQIEALELRFLHDAPRVREAVSRHIERGQAAQRFKRLMGFKCMVCEELGLQPIGFKTRRGDPYVEVHHVTPVSAREPGSLGPSNLIVVCANHHRQIHYGDTVLAKREPGLFDFVIDGHHVRIKRMGRFNRT